MSEKTRYKTNARKDTLLNSLIKGILRQALASALCLLLLLGMSHSQNADANNWAEAFGKALRTETDFKARAESAVNSLKDIISKDGGDNADLEQEAVFR